LSGRAVAPPCLRILIRQTLKRPDEFRVVAPARRDRIDPCPAQPLLIIGMDDQIDGLGQLPPVMSGPVQRCQFIRALVVAECLLEIFHVVEVLPNRVAQQNFFSRRQLMPDNSLRLCDPGRVAVRHFAQAGDAAQASGVTGSIEMARLNNSSASAK